MKNFKMDSSLCSKAELRTWMNFYHNKWIELHNNEIRRSKDLLTPLKE